MTIVFLGKTFRTKNDFTITTVKIYDFLGVDLAFFFRLFFCSVLVENYHMLFIFIFVFLKMDVPVLLTHSLVTGVAVKLTIVGARVTLNVMLPRPFTLVHF